MNRFIIKLLIPFFLAPCLFIIFFYPRNIRKAHLYEGVYCAFWK